jgi:cell division protein ZipA
MDMSLREWLLIVGLIILALILIDGYRRVKRARRDSLEMSIEMGGEIENSPIDEHFNPELPNGGARVVDNLSTQQKKEQEQDISLSTENRQEPWISQGKPKVEESNSHADKSELNTSLTSLYAEKPDESPCFVSSENKTKLNQKVNEDNKDKTLGSIEVTLESNKQPVSGNINKSMPSPLPRWNRKQKQSAKVSKMPDPQEVIVINVLNHTENGFKGSDLKALFEACGMVYGDMSIFHRHEEDSLDSPIQFSVANAVKPGYFPAEEFDTMQTPGVSFFSISSRSS